MSKIQAVLIDDEKHCNETLQFFIEKHLPEIEIKAVFIDPSEALLFLQNNTVDLVFLDVQMPGFNGFELLAKLKPFHFEVIFITAFDSYAIRAIKFSALDYLQKPLDLEELKIAVESVVSKRAFKEKQELFNNLLEAIANGNQELNRLSLPSRNGYVFLNIVDIIWCKAEGNYTILKVRDGSQILATVPFKKIEDSLTLKPFVRTHNSYLINREQVRHLVKGKGYILMTDDEQIPISRYRKDTVIEQLLS
ncbi:LytR/AlgR family response regulator transcription factor [Arcticibacterium luteifluviistationis]|uniref:DNA-binding response regulator n=1 Tax=Arcticibacterium luteifluviistationis TaxID=1784714 RepID=A0A2Z4GAL1_9BACT|nr:LytTR family DNA-binding domain-containing protein [Arcticibacterium luteifluviistationis]AWV98161.1 DNA-binding response regulator [Arcticibacterium luteifluviistationis]